MRSRTTSVVSGKVRSSPACAAMDGFGLGVGLGAGGRRDEHDTATTATRTRGTKRRTEPLATRDSGARQTCRILRGRAAAAVRARGLHSPIPSGRIFHNVGGAKAPD